MNRMCHVHGNALWCLILTGSVQGQVSNTKITYQGQLSQNGELVNHPCDFTFSLWNAGVAGAQVGSTINKPGLQVDGGIFTADLDFGAAALQADPLWLQIAANCTGVTITLAPRQQITAAPFALHTKSVAVEADCKVSYGQASLTNSRRAVGLDYVVSLKG